MKKVAIVGVEGSGKTVLMAAMGDKYETPDANGVFLKPVNRETYSYYTKEMAKLRDGQWPLATESDVLELEWLLVRQSGRNERQERLGHLSFLDFGGEIYRVAFGDKSQSELDALAVDEQRQKAVERLRAHVENADALIVLVNLSDIINGKGNDERTIEMNWLSQAILSFAFERADKKNVALVFTQADTYAETIAQCGGVRGTLAKYLRVVDSNYGDKLSLFDVSAVNKTYPSEDGLGLPMPASDFEPQGLEPLLAWIVKEVEPRRKRRWLSAAMGIVLAGGLGFVGIGYSVNQDFKDWLDGRLSAIGWWKKETGHKPEPRPAAPAEKPSATSTERLLATLVEKPVVQPVIPSAPPKPKVKWTAGAKNPNNPNLVAGEKRNTWVATRPGYAWVEGTDRDEWKRGLRHPDNDDLVSCDREGAWESTKAGYFWTGGSKTEWRANVSHPNWPHVFSSTEKNNWYPEAGYKWVDASANDDMSVVWNPGAIINGRKTASMAGHWLRKCSSCNGSGKTDCWKCDGDGRVYCSRCDGTGKIEATESVECWRCDGTGEITRACSRTDCIINYTYGHLLQGQHVFVCRACGGWGGMCLLCSGLGCEPCSTCMGSNQVSMDCPNCDNGYLQQTQSRNCPDCYGRGTKPCPRSECSSGKVSCSLCGGDGWVED